MYRLLPPPALHSHAPPPPEVDTLVHGGRVAHGVVFAGEEEGWRSNWAVVENLDAVVIEVCCVAFEEPEVKHGAVSDQPL